MNFFDAIQSSGSGLSAQRIRMNLITNNLANSQTTKTAEGGPYKRKLAVFTTQPLETDFDSVLKGKMGQASSEVKVSEIVDDKRQPLLKYDPMHPDADADGFVAMPNINITEEMVDMLSASRSYEANVTAISTTKAMVFKALEIGR
ncbi:flagellar basal body rod protein FlgC [Desulfatirhabdium butyrativorans]|uniref:flagellar basal body rod protein FlgC n=1 Tax=Desulfatirhabdium butyrativorans TaxID=340467 RepID=UPI0003F840BF|nr:flagellar basal body rod protein FlgC [Desulfatirhabdium butyrativorans]